MYVNAFAYINDLLTIHFPLTNNRSIQHSIFLALMSQLPAVHMYACLTQQ